MDIAMTQHPPLPEIHSCDFCSAQEIDPLARSNLEKVFVIRYRGSRVQRGASNGCSFFARILDKFISEHDNDYIGDLQLDFWMYELLIHIPDNYDIRIASSRWRSTVYHEEHRAEMFGIL